MKYPNNRGLPERFTRRWWLLWRSGAIDRRIVFLNVLADEILKYQFGYNGTDVHFLWLEVDAEEIRRGFICNPRFVQLRDLAARIRQDLRIPFKHYERIYEELFKRPLEDRTGWDDKVLV